MKKDNAFVKFSIVLLFYLLMAGLGPTSALGSPFPSATTSNSPKPPTISVTIDDAYYTDLDSDTFADDVYAKITVTVNGATTFTYDYQVTLTLPSGLQFTYLFVITTNIDTISFNNNFFDHALESGWYRIDIEVKLHNGGGHVDKSSYEFDPPGGSCCSDPTFVLD